MALINVLLLAWSLSLVAGMLIALWAAFVVPRERRETAKRPVESS